MGRGCRDVLGANQNVTFPRVGDWLRERCLTPFMLVSFNCGTSAGDIRKALLSFIWEDLKEQAQEEKQHRGKLVWKTEGWIPIDTTEPLSPAMAEASFHP